MRDSGALTELLLTPFEEGRSTVNAGTKLRQRAGVKMHHGGWQIGFCG